LASNWKTKDFAPNDTKQSLTLVCPYFFHAWNFYFLELFLYPKCSTLWTDLFLTFKLWLCTACRSLPTKGNTNRRTTRTELHIYKYIHFRVGISGGCRPTRHNCH